MTNELQVTEHFSAEREDNKQSVHMWNELRSKCIENSDNCDLWSCDRSAPTGAALADRDAVFLWYGFKF